MNKHARMYKDNITIGVFEDRWIPLIRIFREEWGEYSILFVQKRSYSFFADSPELISIIRNMENNSFDEICHDLSKAGFVID